MTKYEAELQVPIEQLTATEAVGHAWALMEDHHFAEAREYIDRALAVWPAGRASPCRCRATGEWWPTVEHAARELRVTARWIYNAMSSGQAVNGRKLELVREER